MICQWDPIVPLCSMQFFKCSLLLWPSHLPPPRHRRPSASAAVTGSFPGRWATSGCSSQRSRCQCGLLFLRPCHGCHGRSCRFLCDFCLDFAADPRLLANSWWFHMVSNIYFQAFLRFNDGIIWQLNMSTCGSVFSVPCNWKIWLDMHYVHMICKWWVETKWQE